MEQILCCPKCQSTQITANKKGFSGRKAVGGAILTGPIGLLAGTLGSNKIILTCLACGHKFRPGQGRMKNVDTPVVGYSERKDIVERKEIEEPTLPEMRKRSYLLFGALLVLAFGVAIISKMADHHEYPEIKDKEPALNQSSVTQLTRDDSIKIGEGLVAILKSINAANVAPQKTMKQFSKYAAGLSDLSTSIPQVYQAAKIAKQKMDIAEAEISSIVLPQLLPEQIKDSISTAMSTIGSSYSTLSGAFNEAMEAAENPSDNAYAEAFKGDLDEAIQMYGQALAYIVEIKFRFKKQDKH